MFWCKNAFVWCVNACVNACVSSKDVRNVYVGCVLYVYVLYVKCANACVSPEEHRAFTPTHTLLEQEADKCVCVCVCVYIYSYS